MISLYRWHQRFQQQAQWSKEVRKYLFKKSNISKSHRIIEIGSGTGAILDDLKNYNIFGIDIDLEKLNYSKSISNLNKLASADAFHLPFKKDTFDHAFCHYFLLWVSSPHDVLKEMIRIIKPDGKVIFLSEPDYGRRIDKPDIFQKIGDLQKKSLISQGADPLIGSKLKYLLSQLGLLDIETGLINSDLNSKLDKESWNLEWEILFNDLENLIGITELKMLKNLDLEMQLSGERELFIPTYYAVGTKTIE